MTIIEIAYGVNEETIEHVESLLEKTALYDPDWSGAEFSIHRGEFTCIPERNDPKAVALLYEINEAIRRFEELIEGDNK